MPEFVDGADEIFAGTLTGMSGPPERGVVSSTDPITYTVAVDAVYRGDVGSVAFFESAMSGASCGLEGMTVDRRYLVFVTHRWLGAGRDLVRRHGSGHACASGRGRTAHRGTR